MGGGLCPGNLKTQGGKFIKYSQVLLKNKKIDEAKHVSPVLCPPMARARSWPERDRSGRGGGEPCPSLCTNTYTARRHVCTHIHAHASFSSECSFSLPLPLWTPPSVPLPFIISPLKLYLNGSLSLSLHSFSVLPPLLLGRGTLPPMAPPPASLTLAPANTHTLQGGPPKKLELIYKKLCTYSYVFKLQSPSEYSILDAIHLSRLFSTAKNSF